jgi:hypothetical protein
MILVLEYVNFFRIDRGIIVVIRWNREEFRKSGIYVIKIKMRDLFK